HSSVVVCLITTHLEDALIRISVPARSSQGFERRFTSNGGQDHCHFEEQDQGRAGSLKCSPSKRAGRGVAPLARTTSLNPPGFHAQSLGQDLADAVLVRFGNLVVDARRRKT